MRLNRRRFINLAAAGLAFAGAAILSRPIRRSVDPVALRARADAIGRDHGIYIGYDRPETFFVPPWTSHDALTIPNGVMTRVEVDAVPAALDGIEQALAVYPPGFVSTRCKAVFICGSMVSDGARAGGTYGPTWIILVASGRFGDGGIYETARLGIHHEFSSLVWMARLDLYARWRTLLPPGYTEAKGDAEALKASPSEEGDVERGFLTPYGATGVENDFNTYAEMVFTDADRVAALADEHPVVAQKLGLVMNAYISLDDRFEDLFKKFGLDRFASTHLPDLFPPILPKGELLPRR
jgi:hypothetical protein